MGEQEAFHAAMLADPNDAHTRSVYADWLDEHDQPEAAKRLRWWASIIPHLTHAGPYTGVGKDYKHIPVWARTLALTHFWRTARKNRPRLEKQYPAINEHHHGSELTALGIPNSVPRDDYLIDPTPEETDRITRAHYGFSQRAFDQVEKAMKESPVKLAAIGGPSAVVRVPVPTPVPEQPRKPQQAVQSQQPSRPRGPVFILPQ